MKTFRLKLDGFGTTWVVADGYDTADGRTRFYIGNDITADYPSTLVREVQESTHEAPTRLHRDRDREHEHSDPED